jgi:hypothetical protein
MDVATNKPKVDEEVVLTDAEGRRYCRVRECDQAAISLLTPSSVSGYKIAAMLRARGAKVVFGGIHASLLPEEAMQHGDAVVSGEAESAWPQVLRDFKSGNLKKFYQGDRLQLDDLPTPLYGMLKHGHQFRIVNTSRGCPYNCTFCSVKPFMGADIRFRPIDHVVRDVHAIPEKMYINGDENIWWQGFEKRAIDMFKALKGSGKKWMGFGSLRPVMTPAVLNAARESGMLTVWVGWDAISDDALLPIVLTERSALIGNARLRLFVTMALMYLFFICLAVEMIRLTISSVQWNWLTVLVSVCTLHCWYRILVRSCGVSMNRIFTKTLAGNITPVPMLSLSILTHG